MPRKQVKPVEVINHGKVRYRIFIPKALTGGRRKTLWFKSESTALEKAKRLNIDLATKFRGVTTMGVNDQVVLSRLLSQVGTLEELEKAVAFYKAHNPKETRKISPLCAECVEDKEKSGLSAKYLSSFQNTLRRFQESFATVDAQTITGVQINNWLNGGGWEAITRHGYLTDIRTLFSYALRRKYVAFNPALDVDLPKVTKKPPGIFTPAQCKELLTAVRKHDRKLVPFISLVLFGGFRPSEARKLNWAEVRKEFVDLPAAKAKNNHRRLVKKTKTLSKWLRLGGDLPVMNLEKRLARVRKKTKLPWPHDVLRHSFCSYSVPIHGIPETARMADHSESVLKHNYLEVVHEKDAKTFWSLIPKP